MGKIAKQSIINTILSFVGIAIGAFYTLFIVPKAFAGNPDEWGLIQLINSFVMIFLPFALVGFPNIIIKYWSKYQEHYNNQFSFFLFLLVTAGFIIVSIVIFIFRDALFLSNSPQSTLMQHYLPHFFVIFTLNTYFYFILYFARVYYRTVFPTFLKDTFIKIWTFALMLAYAYFKLSFNLFFYLFFSGYIIILIASWIYIKRTTTINLKPNFGFLKKRADLKDILRYGFYSILAGGAGVLVSRVDIFLVNKLIDLSNVAFYSVALFFITVIQVPLRSVTTITIPIISDFFYKNNNQKVNQIYKETGISLFLTSSFIFLIIALNINEFMQILGPKFGQVKWVILILGVSKVYESVNSLNGTILIISRYFKYDIIFQFILLTLTVLSNLYFIPRYGLNGAAMATGLATVLNSFIRTLFIRVKFGLILYSKKYISGLIVVLVTILSVWFVNFSLNIYIAMILKSLIITTVFGSLSVILNVSQNINDIFYNVLSKIGIKTTKHM